jgi:hypothetical protein
VAGIALPDLAVAARWLLPGVALAVGSLLLATYVRPVHAVALLAVGWLALVVTVRTLDGRSLPLAETAVFDLRGQVVALILASISVALLYVRREHFSTVEVTW